jgi:N-acetylglucosaminyl-diphospho-decaprenol L-rhamnosyltransferase
MTDAALQPTPTQAKTLAVVIVNWNAGDLLRACLVSLNQAALPAGWRLQVIVVDNASHDQSLERLPPLADLHVLRQAENLGFGAACNVGAAHAPTADLLLFLNPDTTTPEQTLVHALGVLAQQAPARVGILGVQMRDEQGKPVHSCSRFPQASRFVAQALGFERLWPLSGHLMREWNHGDSRVVDQVIGAFFLVRREVYNVVGGFDERFFVYYEEVDFSLRAKQAGWLSYYDSAAGVYHEGGGTSKHIKARRLFYALRSRLAYADKHFSVPARGVVWACTWVLEPLTRACQLLLTGRMAELKDLGQAYRLLATSPRSPNTTHGVRG